MATQIQEIQMSDGEKIFVAVEVSDDIAVPIAFKEIKDLPPGAEPTGVVNDAIMSMYLFKACIKSMAKSARDALKDVNPDEFSVEMNIGFIGKTNPIPFIAGADLQGGVKVTATWKKEEEKKTTKKKITTKKKKV